MLHVETGSPSEPLNSPTRIAVGEEPAGTLVRQVRVDGDDGLLIPALPGAVRESWLDAFSFREADEARGRPGLRVPQLGAVHAVLGYWSTGSRRPATVVIPTGSGKTETMLALLTAARLERLLVIVPSDALREQLATKFERLGLLPELGVLPSSAQPPTVGRLLGQVSSSEQMQRFADQCNVIVSTPNALMASTEDVQATLLEACSELFVDEAHHVRARTWERIRSSFQEKRCVQFTATPFREDGKHLGGDLVYNFPLREAQRLGYFSRVKYISVFDLLNEDRAVATQAIQSLRDDLAAGYDHILMARTNSLARAQEIFDLYSSLSPDLRPIELHTGLGARAKRENLAALRNRETRIVVCVDMLGEGFDLPQLKIAALHDPHRSLGVTLQFVGRFARSGYSVGEATVVAAQSEASYDPRLARLYSQDADWDQVIEELSASAAGREAEVSEFERNFASLPEQVPIRSIMPKMSTVIYSTFCEEWSPEGVLGLYDRESLLTYPIAVNQRDRVLWFVVTRRAQVRWSEMNPVEEVTYQLFVAHWDRAKGYLYINSSANEGTYEELARAICGDTVRLVRGETVYRVMAGLQRLVATNVGVLDVFSRARRFSMHVGADVAEGFPTAEAATKTQTNIFAHGFENGDRVTVGASLKGRIWSHQVAPTVKHWVDWCDRIGEKVANPAINVAQIMKRFIRPTVLGSWPDSVTLGLEWPPDVLLDTMATLELCYDGVAVPLREVSLTLTDQGIGPDVQFAFETEHWRALYRIKLDNVGMKLVAEDVEATVVTSRRELPVSGYFHGGLMAILAGDAVVVPPGVLLSPPRDTPTYDRGSLKAIDWNGIDLHQESRGQDRNEATVQGRMLAWLRESTWNVVLDDDGPGEVADLVALRLDEDVLHITLVHCKYASGEPGARVGDLYEVCGQAHKSTIWKRNPEAMLRKLLRRERSRVSSDRRSGVEVGSARSLMQLQSAVQQARTELTVVLAQPGVSKSRASTAQLDLLGATELYVHDTSAGDLVVFCSA